MNQLDKDEIAKVKTQAAARVAALKEREAAAKKAEAEGAEPVGDLVAFVTFPAGALKAALDAVGDKATGTLKEIVRGWRQHCAKLPGVDCDVYAHHALAVIEAAEGGSVGKVSG